MVSLGFVCVCLKFFLPDFSVCLPKKTLKNLQPITCKDTFFTALGKKLGVLKRNKETKKSECDGDRL